MNLHTYNGGLFQTNGFVLAFDDQSCLVIDAPTGISDFIAGLGLKPIALLLTHQHIDHVDDCAAVQKMGAEIYAWQAFAPGIIMIDRVKEMGWPTELQPFQVNHVLEGRTSFEVAGKIFEISHTPGHSPDSIFFHLPTESFVFSGDLVMFQSIGRPDLPGGDLDQLLDSIRKKLYTLPEETALFPGHGPQSTIATEKLHNQACPA